MFRIYKSVILSHLALWSLQGRAHEDPESLRHEAQRLRQRSQDLQDKSTDFNCHAQKNQAYSAQNRSLAQDVSPVASRYSEATGELGGLLGNLNEENEGWMAQLVADEQQFLTFTQALTFLQARLDTEKRALEEQLREARQASNESKSKYLEARKAGAQRAGALDTQLQDTFESLVFEQNQRMERQWALKDTFENVLMKRYITLIGLIDAILDTMGADLKEAYEFIVDIKAVVQDFEKIVDHLETVDEKVLQKSLENLKLVQESVSEVKSPFSQCDNALMSLMADVDELSKTLFVEAYKIDDAEFANERLVLIKKFNTERNAIANQIHSFLTASHFNQILYQFKVFLSKTEQVLTQHLTRLESAEYERLKKQTVINTRATFLELTQNALLSEWKSVTNAHLLRLKANLNITHVFDVMALQKCGQDFYKALSKYLGEIEASSLPPRDKHELSNFLRVNGLRIFISFLKDIFEHTTNWQKADYGRALFEAIAIFQVLPESTTVEVAIASWLEKIGVPSSTFQKENTEMQESNGTDFKS